MQFLCTLGAVLVLYVVFGTSLERYPSTNRARGKGFQNPKTQPANQHNFKIHLRKLETDIVYGDFISDKTNFNVEMYNDSLAVINGKLYLLKDFSETLQIQVIGSRFSASNQWIPSFDQGKQLFCHYMETNVSFMKNVLIASNFKECPFKKGVYTVSNMVVDEKGFPPGVPECMFKIDAIFTDGNKKVARLTVFADVVQNDDDD